MIRKRDNEIVTERKREDGTIRNRRVSIDCSGPSKTEQTHKDRVNIVKIMKKANRIGMMPNMERIQTARYGDFTGANDYQSIMNRVIQANNQFEMLPSEIREKFMNSPAKLIEFLNNPANMDEAVKLGLRKAPIAPEPASTPAKATEPATEPQTAP